MIESLHCCCCCCCCNRQLDSLISLADKLNHIQICNEWNKSIFCFKNQCASDGHINISIGDVSVSIAIACSPYLYLYQDQGFHFTFFKEQNQHWSYTSPSSTTLIRSCSASSSVVILLLSFIASVTIFPCATCSISVERSSSRSLSSSVNFSGGRAAKAWSEGTKNVQRVTDSNFEEKPDKFISRTNCRKLRDSATSIKLLFDVWSSKTNTGRD